MAVEDSAETDEHGRVQSQSVHRKGTLAIAGAEVRQASRHASGFSLIVILVHHFTDLLERLPPVAVLEGPPPPKQEPTPPRHRAYASRFAVPIPAPDEREKRERNNGEKQEEIV
uniref:Uncharacterized protein n=1 Tax=Oryza meridionalis TaxID=40149 RepID=A0A0E0EKX0_9ORYZ